MAQSKLYPVVMAGGSGSRLWPLSRVLYPKQFLCLKGDLTMLQTTICRLNGVECESPVVICSMVRNAGWQPMSLLPQASQSATAPSWVHEAVFLNRFRQMWFAGGIPQW